MSLMSHLVSQEVLGYAFEWEVPTNSLVISSSRKNIQGSVYLQVPYLASSQFEALLPYLTEKQSHNYYFLPKFSSHLYSSAHLCLYYDATLEPYSY